MKKVALIGKTNVGKSTLFNRLVGQRSVIVKDSPHITRDYLEKEIFFQGIPILLQDTGGWDFTPGDEMDTLVTEKSTLALHNADLVILVIDGQLGVTRDDLEVSRLVNRLEKPTVLAVNKCDDSDQKNITYDFYQLGIRDIFQISAIHGRGISELMDFVIKNLNLCKSEQVQPEVTPVRIAFTGVPNAGKSSLCNALIGDSRSIVHHVPGTTRDSVNTKMKFRKHVLEIIDTAGIRRASRVRDSEDAIEYFSLDRAKKSIDSADVAVFVLDASQKISHHEQTLAGYLRENWKCLIIALNKWDLISDSENYLKKKKAEIELKLKFCGPLPVITVSALDNLRTVKLLDEVLKVYDAKNHFIDPSELKSELSRALMVQNFTVKGQGVMLRTVKQSRWNCPTFDICLNVREKIPVHMKRFLEKCIREIYPYSGCPLRIIIK